MSLASDAELQQQASSKQRGRLKRFAQTISACDDLREREKAALRAQVHDLTELLAAFDLCELRDAHLSAVRDRAFQRDLSPDRELLQVYLQERQTQQGELVNGMVDVAAEKSTASSDPGESISSDMSEAKSLPLPLRVELLEKDVLIVKLQNKLLEERLLQVGASPILHEESLEKSEYSESEGESGQQSVGYDGDPWSSGSCGSESFEHDNRHAEAEVEGYREQGECSIFEKDSAGTIHELQQRIVELESAVEVEVARNEVLQQRVADLEREVEMEATRNGVLQQQSHRIHAVEDILHEFTRRR